MEKLKQVLICLCLLAALACLCLHFYKTVTPPKKTVERIFYLNYGRTASLGKTIQDEGWHVKNISVHHDNDHPESFYGYVVVEKEDPQ